MAVGNRDTKHKMTLFDQHSTLRQPLYSFLPLTDLLSVSSVNRSLYDETHDSLRACKKEKATAVFDALYRPAQKSFALKHYYFESAITYVRSVFDFIPELFELMQSHDCKQLQLSMKNDYTGGAEGIEKHYGGDVPSLLRTILDGLRANTTLTSCTIGLFRAHVNRRELEEMLSVHPTLTRISLSSGERVFAGDLPVFLCKTRDGCVWSHEERSN